MEKKLISGPIHSLNPLETRFKDFICYDNISTYGHYLAGVEELVGSTQEVFSSRDFRAMAEYLEAGHSVTALLNFPLLRGEVVSFGLEISRNKAFEVIQGEMRKHPLNYFRYTPNQCVKSYHGELSDTGIRVLSLDEPFSESELAVLEDLRDLQ